MDAGYTIDAKRSTVRFSATSSVHPIDIRGTPEGRFTLGAAASGSLVVPIGSLKTGQLVQDLELRRQLQARRYKTIAVAVRSITPASGDTYEARGDVTFFGTTLTAKGALTVVENDDELTVSGEALFDVTEFGFNPPNILGVRVHPEVTVQIDVVATRV